MLDEYDELVVGMLIKWWKYDEFGFSYWDFNEAEENLICYEFDHRLGEFSNGKMDQENAERTK